MKKSTKPTLSCEYWIHTQEDGFEFFKNKHKLVKIIYLITSSHPYWHYSTIYNKNFLVGEDNLHHFKNDICYGSHDRKFIPFVISHDILDDLKFYAATLKKQNPGNLKHEKGYSYRAIRTFQERKMYMASLDDAKYIKENYGVILKNTREYTDIPNPWDDYYFSFENNWKSDRRKYKKQWMKNTK